MEELNIIPKHQTTLEEWLGHDNTIGIDIWSRKYQYNKESFPKWIHRVSGGNRMLANLILQKKFLFGGRILSNRGLNEKGVKCTYSNCYVITPPEDSLESIFECATKLARTFSYGGGCGVDLSRLAPKGANVNNSARKTSGAVSFMNFYSNITELIGQNGRRGALMLSIDCNHPDLEEFIQIKSDLDKVTKANISVKITDAFIAAALTKKPYELEFYRPESNETIHKTVDANKILTMLAQMNWDYAEPGALFWDRIKNWNLLSNSEEFEYAGVNPCAEEPLPAGGSCLLGSINLSEFVQLPFEQEAYFDFDEFTEAVQVAVTALNDVLDEGLPFHPLEEQNESVANWRQIGLGVFGIADMFIKMGIPYGSDESIVTSKYIGDCLINTALRQSAKLAKEHGAFPKCNIQEILQTEFIKQNANSKTKELIAQYGLRNSQLLTIAPTGSLSTMIGVSGGIEPIYAFSYNRKTESLYEHDKTYKVYTKIVQDYMNLKGISEEQLPDFFVCAKTLEYEKRLKMQGIWQNYIDASISSTVNVDENFTVEETKTLYLKAWEYGLKGVTIYRDNCKRSGILSTSSSEIEKDKENSLSRGEVIHCSDDLIGKKRKLTVGCGTIHCQAWFDKKSGELRETFLSKGSTGGCKCNEDAVSRLISLASRGGISQKGVTDQLLSCGGCDAYRARTVTKKDTSKGSSCPVAVGYAIQDMQKEIGHELGLKQKTVSIAQANTRNCPECNEKIYFEGGCNICKSCGWSKCD